MHSSFLLRTVESTCHGNVSFPRRRRSDDQHITTRPGADPRPPDPADVLRRRALHVLDVAARIDFDARFRRGVERNAPKVLRDAGLPDELLDVLLGDGSEVTAFSDDARMIAARAHAWATEQLQRLDGYR